MKTILHPRDARKHPSREDMVSGRLSSGAARKVVLVHGGARDSYQFALALSDSGLLEALVTDLFWPLDQVWTARLSRRLPQRIVARLKKRSAPGLPSDRVKVQIVAGIGGLLMDHCRRIPFAIRRKWARSADATLGSFAGNLARQEGSGLVSYSYFGYDAFKAYGRGGLLFQVHPHAETMREILREELRRNPDCASSLNTEWELSLPEDDFQRLVKETSMASRYIAASSFTRASLIAQGVKKESITVIPYGVDLHRFAPSLNKARTASTRLQLLFVGRINQRKGLKYLLEALRLLQGHEVELTICGRVVDDLQMLHQFRSQIVLRPHVTSEELVKAYQSADLFVFPSVGEGFGQVLLEALASGLPILSTTHTAAPDLIEEGVQGFIVEPRRPDLLAERISWAARHRKELAAMGPLARQRAECFTWERFRKAATEAVRSYLVADGVAAEGRASCSLGS